MNEKTEVEDDYLSSKLVVKEPNDYLRDDLIFIATQLDNHLAEELSNCNNQRCSRISDRLLRLAEVTAEMNKLAFIQITDIETVVKNSMG